MTGASAREEDINGFVTVVKNPITRTGVFQYLGSSIGGDADPHKIYNVYRPAESLQDVATQESMKLIPIIDDHEMLGDPQRGMTPAEHKGVEGTTGEQLEFDPVSGILFSNLRIYSRRLLAKIKSGKCDLSLGYRCAYKKIAGFFNGMPYDYIQVNMQGNHLALVDEARCNVSVLDSRLTYDARDVITISPSGDIQMTEEEKKAKEAEDKKAKDAKDAAEAAESEKKAKDEKEASDRKAKDEAEEKEKKEAADKKARDEAEEKKKDDEKGMDAKMQRIAEDAAAKALASAPTFADFAKEAVERDALRDKLVPFIGAFDAKEKTLAEVQAYGVEKLKLNAKKGEEGVALDGFIAGAALRKVGTATGFALDAANAGGTVSKAASKISSYITSAKSA